MKHLFLFLSYFLPLSAWAQGEGAIEPPEGETELSRWDSIQIIDSDTANSLPAIGILGDVLSGYSILGTVFGTDGLNQKRCRLWQRDANGNPVRQLVVLNEKWPNTPPDILFNPAAEAGGEDGGYKLAAVTPAQYEALKRDSLIWGEAWQMFYPSGITNGNKDTVPNRPGYEISCVKLGCEWAPFTGVASRVYSREMMSFRDTAEDGSVRSYMCMAANLVSCQADYTPGQTGYKYDTRWMLCDEAESRYWMDKWVKAQEEQAEEDGYLRSYRDWLLKIMKNDELRKKNRGAGNVSFLWHTSLPQERQTYPQPFWQEEDVASLQGAILGNVLSGYETVALPFDGQSTRFRWFWTDSAQALGKQIVVLKLPSPYAPDSLAAGGGLALAAVDLEAYGWFAQRGLIWGECWEVSPSKGGFEFVCLAQGAEWMAEDDPQYLPKSRELVFYWWDNGRKRVPVPTVGANRTQGFSDYPPLYFPVRMVRTEAKTNIH